MKMAEKLSKTQDSQRVMPRGKQGNENFKEVVYIVQAHADDNPWT